MAENAGRGGIKTNFKARTETERERARDLCVDNIYNCYYLDSNFYEVDLVRRSF